MFSLGLFWFGIQRCDFWKYVGVLDLKLRDFAPANIEMFLHRRCLVGAVAVFVIAEPLRFPPWVSTNQLSYQTILWSITVWTKRWERWQ